MDSLIHIKIYQIHYNILLNYLQNYIYIINQDIFIFQKKNHFPFNCKRYIVFISDRYQNEF